MRRVPLALIAAALAAGLLPMPASLVERWYSRGVYPRVQPIVTGVASVMPVAPLDAALGLLLVGLAVAGVRTVRRRGWRPAAGGSAVVLVATAAIVYLWFLLTWGLNYRRVPLEQKVAYDPARITRQQGVAFARRAVNEVNAGRLQALAPLDEVALARALVAVTAKLGAPRDALLPSPKPSLLQWYFRKAAIDGMTDPFFLQIVLNPDVLPFERPFVLAHEWAHVSGYADESEANYLAWLACITGPDTARYSGWVAAFEHVVSGLPREDRRELQQALGPLVVADMAAARARLDASSPTVRLAARGAYDTYLRANRIEEGVANYNVVVRLMLGTTLGPDSLPQLK